MLNMLGLGDKADKNVVGTGDVKVVVDEQKPNGKPFLEQYELGGGWTT